LKTVEEIYEALKGEYADRAGCAPLDGSELSVRLYTYAAQIQSLYAHMDWVETQAFPQTASGEALTRHADARGLSRKEGDRATGQLCFGRTEATPQDLPVPAGTVCLTAGMLRFETVAPGVLPAGELLVYVPARACEAGVSGNVPAGAVTLMSLPPPGISWCANPTPFTGGRDGEDDASLRARLLDNFRRLPNGANAAFYQAEALRQPGVAAVTVLPRVNGRGTVGVVIAAADGLPGEALVETVRQRLQDMREIAVDVTVSAPAPLPVLLTVAVDPAPGVSPAEALQNAETALRSRFEGGLLGRPLLLAELQSWLYGTPGVRNFRILSPEADVPVSPEQLPVLDELTLLEMEG
jgi:uncharacterized phage protein gp47/JayE